jgi:hypothetical protein
VPQRSDRPVYTRLLIGILVSYAVVISVGGTSFGDPARLVVLGMLLWFAARLHGMGRYRWWAIGVTGVFVVVAVLADRLGSARVAYGFVGAATLLMITALIVAIASEVIRIGRIDTPTVLGVLCVYLLLALFFASVNQVLAAFQPSYLHGASAPPTGSDLLYFSVITLATVGYGDITPATEVARAVVVLEALTGQLYLVSVVAAVVGGWQRKPRS